MKKVLNLLVIAVAVLTVFTSCNPSQTASDELVSVSIIGLRNSARSLVAENDFNIDNVKSWTYTANKADSGIKTGETTEALSLTKDSSGNWMTQPLSQGSWNFKLFGYNADNKLICTGSADNQLITVQKHNVKITVKPSQTENGKIVVDSTIKIVDKNGNVYSGVVYTMDYTVTNSSSEDVTATVKNGNAVTSGQYKVTVMFTATSNGETYTAASASKFINVYDNLTTTVSGTITEIEQAAELVADDFVKEINNAASGATVKLNSSSAIYEDVTITKSLTIDLNGNTLTISPYVDFTIGDSSLTENITVTIKNGKIDGEGYLINDVDNATIKIENVSCTAKRRSTWNGTIYDDSSNVTSVDDAANAEAYISWFDEQFISTAKASFEKGTEANTLIIYDARLFASSTLYKKYFDAQKVATGSTSVNQIVRIDADFDLNNKEWTPIVIDNYQIDFDFNNHTISNLKITESKAIYVNGHVQDDAKGALGLFTSQLCSVTSTDVSIKNLTITDADVTASDCSYVAVLIGYAANYVEISEVTVMNSKVKVIEVKAKEGDVQYAGAIAGQWYSMKAISNCKVINVTVEGPEQVGGIVGFIQGSTKNLTTLGEYAGAITNCEVKNSTVAATRVSAGGIAGKAYSTTDVKHILKITGNKVSDSTVTVAGNEADANIGYKSSYCGYICGGKYINTATSGVETVYYSTNGGTTIIEDNIWSTT